MAKPGKGPAVVRGPKTLTAASPFQPMNYSILDDPPLKELKQVRSRGPRLPVRRLRAALAHIFGARDARSLPPSPAAAPFAAFPSRLAECLQHAAC